MRVPHPINKKFTENFNKLLDNYTNELILLCETGDDALRIAEALEHESFNFPSYSVSAKDMAAEARAIVQAKINKRPIR